MIIDLRAIYTDGDLEDRNRKQENMQIVISDFELRTMIHKQLCDKFKKWPSLETYKIERVSW